MRINLFSGLFCLVTGIGLFCVHSYGLAVLNLSLSVINLFMYWDRRVHP